MTKKASRGDRMRKFYKNIPEEELKKMMSDMGKKSQSKRTKKQKSEHGRMMARARWNKHKKDEEG
jgi:uncharacterized protein YneF (UPF0154 family)